jgi:redox-sensing transcriptional repressor
VAVFDNDPGKVGKRLGPFTIQALADLQPVVQREQIRLAILAVPADNAQDVADQVVAAGVRGLLNFAPVSINVPAQVAVTTVDVAVHLEQLSFQVNVTPAEKAG